MRVLYDGYIYSIQKNGGINKYFKNLLDRLPAEVDATLTLKKKNENCFPTNPRIKKRLPFSIFGNTCNYFRKRHRANLKKWETPEFFDIAHPTYHDLLSESLLADSTLPLVLTIHDMIPELYPDDFTGILESTERKHRAIERADKIICVSNNTKLDLMRLLSVPENKISVIHLASDLDESMVDPDWKACDSPYILFVGARTIYKNFTKLLHAFHKAKAEWPELKLLLVGAELTATEQTKAAQLGVSDCILILQNLDDQKLATTYHNAQALVYPSMYEGFGIPPLEAMACGTLVITSNRSSIPEVVGDAAFLIDPNSVEEMTSKILGLKNLGPNREILINRCKQQAQTFCWQKSTDKIVNIYKEVATINEKKLCR